jgi:hypothetical protein
MDLGWLESTQSRPHVFVSHFSPCSVLISYGIPHPSKRSGNDVELAYPVYFATLCIDGLATWADSHDTFQQLVTTDISLLWLT